MPSKRMGRAAPAAPAAVAYLRVSTEEQATSGVSLAAQRETAEAYCRLHGLDLAQVFADEGRSGCRADNRPGLRDAIQAASAARAVLVVHSLSRLARSTRDAIDIADRLSARRLLRPSSANTCARSRPLRRQ